MRRKTVAFFLTLSVVIPAEAVPNPIIGRDVPASTDWKRYGIQVRAWTPVFTGVTDNFDGSTKQKPSAWKPLVVYGPMGTVLGVGAGYVFSAALSANLAKPCARQMQFSGTIAGMIGGSSGALMQGFIGLKEPNAPSGAAVIAGAAAPAVISTVLLMKRSQGFNPLYAGILGGVSAWISSSLVRYFQSK